MTMDVELKELSLSGIRHRCAQESDRFFQRQSYDPAYCFELFRRAILEQDERAWELVVAQYRSLVAGWVRRHPRFTEIDEDVSYVLNGAFARLWQYVKPDKFADFPDLPSILRYLQMCVNSVIEDVGRRMEYALLLDDMAPPAPAGGGRDSAVEDRVLNRVQRHEFWLQVSQRLKSEKERAVMHGRFVLGLKPRELCGYYPDLFVDVDEVYRIKENVMDRLRRDLELANLVGKV